MFSKLLKYEFKGVSKPLTVASIGALFAGGLGGFLLWNIYDGVVMEEYEVLLTVMTILLGGVFIALTAYGIGTEILLLYRFYKNKFSDEGYLTFTTPASTHQILLASILNILFWSLICGFVLSASLGLIILPLVMANPQFFNIYDVISSVLSEINIQTGDVLLALFSMVSSMIYALVLPLLSITIGSLIAKKHKLLCAFAVGYGISMAVSTLDSVINVSFYLDELSGVVESTTSSLQSVYLVPAVIQLIIGVGGYFLMHYLIDKKLNI